MPKNLNLIYKKTPTGTPTPTAVPTTTPTTSPKATSTASRTASPTAIPCPNVSLSSYLAAHSSAPVVSYIVIDVNGKDPSLRLTAPPVVYD